MEAIRKVAERCLTVFVDKSTGGKHSCPKPVFVADGGLSDVRSANDLAGHFEQIFSFVPSDVGVEFYTERRRQHAGSQIFRVLAGLFFGLAEGMMLGKVTILFLIGSTEDQCSYFPSCAIPDGTA